MRRRNRGRRSEGVILLPHSRTSNSRGKTLATAGVSAFFLFPCLREKRLIFFLFSLKCIMGNKTLFRIITSSVTHLPEYFKSHVDLCPSGEEKKTGSGFRFFFFSSRLQASLWFSDSDSGRSLTQVLFSISSSLALLLLKNCCVVIRQQRPRWHTHTVSTSFSSKAFDWSHSKRQEKLIRLELFPKNG